MKLKNIARAAASAGVVAAMALALAGCGSSAESDDESLTGTISTNGSTSMEAVIGSLSEAYMAENEGVTITYDATGSGTGIESASNGSADIGLASRALKDDETGLETITIALDGIVVVVNSENGVEDLTLEQVKQIFTGEITNWSEVGGDDLEIACIGREAGSGTRDGFESITDTEDACVLSQELTSTGAVITAVASSPNAIGYASLSAVEGQDGINSVTIDGVECSEETVQDGTYAIQRPFNMLISEDGTSDLVQAFIDYCTSEEAADLIREAGAVPLA